MLSNGGMPGTHQLKLSGFDGALLIHTHAMRYTFPFLLRFRCGQLAFLNLDEALRGLRVCREQYTTCSVFRNSVWKPMVATAQSTGFQRSGARWSGN
jgi:hypothetical protein